MVRQRNSVPHGRPFKPIHEIELPENASPREIVWAALSDLKPREQEVLGFRYGLKWQRKEVLDEVGRRFELSRERIRQIEAKALKRLLLPRRRRFMGQAIDLAQEQIWAALASNGSVVLKKYISWRVDRLPGELMLAIDCIHESVENWLSANAHEHERGWFRTEFSEEEIRRTVVQLDSAANNLLLPRTTASVADALHADPDLLDIAAPLANQLASLNGYITRSPLTSRRRRCVWLHVLMSERFPGQPILIRKLVAQFNAAFPNENCSPRDAEITMARASHLFLKLGDAGWTAIGQSSKQLRQLGNEEIDQVEVGPDAGAASQDLAQEQSDEQTLANQIRIILAEEGPLPFVRIKERVKESSGSRFSLHSIGPILILGGNFVRLAPSIYGLWQHYEDLDPIKTVSPQLLENWHCRLYSMARRAGEPANAYPLWTPAMEHAMCVWAERRADEMLLQSLLAVVEPNVWPVSVAERTLWFSKKQRNSFYQLEASYTPRLEQTPPNMKELLAIALFTKQRGFINWISANRVAGRRPDYQGVASALALLVALGGISAPKHWQRRHGLGRQIDKIIESLSQDLHRTGSLDWAHGVGPALRKQLSQVTGSGELGWVDAAELEALVGSLPDSTSSPVARPPLESETEDADEPSELDLLLRMQRGERREEAIDSTLKALVEE